MGLSAAQNVNDVNLVLERTAGNDTVKFTAGSGVNLTVTGSAGSEQIEIAAPNTNQAAVFISNPLPTANVDAGDMWWDKTTGESYIYYNDGDSSQWVQFAPQQRGTGNGTVTSVTAGTGLTGGTFTTTGTVALADTAVTIGTYGDADSVAQFTVDQQGRITGAANVDIDLDAAAVSSGIFNVARIPDLSANKITSDTLGVDRIPDLSANKITSDTLGVDRIPDLAAGKITSGTFHVDRIPTRSKAKISSTGTWNVADIPDLSATYLTAVSADTSPQLGANLDVAGNSIVSASNGNITLNPNGTGVVSFANNTGTTYVNGNYGVTIKPPTLGDNRDFVLPGFSVTFPATDGTAGQYLKTDGSGNLSWGTDTTYSLGGAGTGTNNEDFLIRLADSGNNNDDITLKAGTGVSLDNSVNNECTISVAAVPTGAIMWWTNATIPSGWLECKGQALSRTDPAYDALKLAIGNTFATAGHRDTTQFPLNNYPETDYFTVPDLRGQFIRGLDTAGTTDEDARTLGQEQTDQFQDHKHRRGGNMTGAFGGSGGSSVFGTGTGAAINAYVTIEEATDLSAANPHRAGTETRPRNIAMIAIIKT